MSKTAIEYAGDGVMEIRGLIESERRQLRLKFEQLGRCQDVYEKARVSSDIEKITSYIRNLRDALEFYKSKPLY